MKKLVSKSKLRLRRSKQKYSCKVKIEALRLKKNRLQYKIKALQVQKNSFEYKIEAPKVETN